MMPKTRKRLLPKMKRCVKSDLSSPLFKFFAYPLFVGSRMSGSSEALEASINSTLLAELSTDVTCNANSDQLGLLLGAIVPPIRNIIDDDDTVQPDLAVIRGFQPLCDLLPTSSAHLCLTDSPPQFPPDTLGFYRSRRRAPHTLSATDALLHSRYGGLFALISADSSVADAPSVQFTVLHAARPIRVVTPNLTESSANEYAAVASLTPLIRAVPRSSTQRASPAASAAATAAVAAAASPASHPTPPPTHPSASTSQPTAPHKSQPSAVSSLWRAADEAFNVAASRAEGSVADAEVVARRVEEKTALLAQLEAKLWAKTMAEGCG